MQNNPTVFSAAFQRLLPQTETFSAVPVKGLFRVKHRIIKHRGAPSSVSHVWMYFWRRQRGCCRDGQRPIETAEMRTIELWRNGVMVVGHACDRSGSEVPAVSSLHYLPARSHKHTQVGNVPLLASILKACKSKSPHYMSEVSLHSIYVAAVHWLLCRFRCDDHFSNRTNSCTGVSKLFSKRAGLHNMKMLKGQWSLLTFF